jgi:hypothetical protein
MTSVSQSRATWRTSELADDQRWIFTLDDRARADMLDALDKARDPDKTLLDYRREDFPLGSAWPVISAALDEAKHGRGMALVRGLPRDGINEKDFELLTWAIGLNAGVGRPQGKASHYLSGVRDIGTDYRSATGRGYSSNARLDFHTDSCDVVALSCFNKAASGGLSLITSSIAAYDLMAKEHPALVDLLREPVHFSRQGEQAADEAPSYPHPIFDEAGGKLFSRWNRNRVLAAQKLDGVPQLSAPHREALECFDALLSRPELNYTMYLEPGDMQLLNSHVTLHARTDFVDHDAWENKRLLFRLWLAPPDSEHLPESWRVAYRAVEPGAVRGGILGQQYNEVCRAFDLRQAADLGMTVPS